MPTKTNLQSFCHRDTHNIEATKDIKGHSIARIGRGEEAEGGIDVAKGWIRLFRTVDQPHSQRFSTKF